MKTSKVTLISVLSIFPIVAWGGPGDASHGHADKHMHESSHSTTHSGVESKMHGEHAHHIESIAGTPGKERDVSRTVKVVANDSMKFIHPPLEVKDNETVKFVITNTGAVVHEFSIATKDEHTEHGKVMMQNPNMHHGPGGSSVTINPGETEELIWRFEEADQVEVACNIPGHYGAGMHSPVKFK